jgi:hypothetical protein
MRTLQVIPTPWAAYSVAFSHDGTRLAVGGGSWYGDGGIVLVDLVSGERRLLRSAILTDAPGFAGGPPTVSGVSFSADDRHLAASTWTSRHNPGPVVLFAVSGISLTHRATFEQAGSHWGAPTGVLLHGRTVAACNWQTAADSLLDVWQAPADAGVSAERAPHHLTSARLTVARGRIIAGAGNCLLSASLGNPKRDAELIPVLDGVTVAAIGSRPGGEAFVTGGHHGELLGWTWQDGWRQQRLRGATSNPRPNWPGIDLVWATYTPNSIVGVCSLPIGDAWASVSAGGEVCLWSGDDLVRSWQLSEPGSPRSLAAHSDRPMLAVGIKKGGFSRPQSAVVLLEADAGVDTSWRTPDVLALAKAARPSPDQPLDPARLAVLADALEEAGCSDAALLSHLRDHGLRLRSCWVIERLLGE